MRILLLTDQHAATGGAEKYFFALKSALQQLPGWQVHSLGFSQEEMVGDDFQTLPTTRTKWSKLFWQIFTHRRTLKKLRAAITTFKPDVIHLHNIKQHTPAILRAVRGYRVVQTIHDYSSVCPAALNLHKDWNPCPTGFQFSCFWQHQLKFNRAIYLGLVLSYLLNRKRSHRAVHHFITVSPLLADYLKKQQYQPVSYIPPFKNEVVACTTEPNPNHFLYAGQLGAYKGTEILLKEFALAVAENPHLQLTIAGSGEHEQALRQLAKQLQIENHLHFTGWLDDLTPLYQSHLAVIAPSLVMESFGLVISEAMSHGRATIGSNRGSIPWLVTHNESGLIFNPHLSGDLAKSILQLSNNPDLAKALGANARKRLDHLINNPTTLNQIITLYQRI